MWFILSLISAISVSLSDFLAKVYMKDLNPKDTALVRFITSSIFIIPLLPFKIDEISKLNHTIYLYLILLIPLEIVAFILYSQAIRIAHISLVMPITAFSPLLVAITSMIILGEYPSLLGLTGILLIAVGSFMIFKTRGVREESNLKGIIYMSIATVIYAFTTTISKECVIIANPFTFALLYYPLISTAMAIPVVILYNKEQIRDLLKKTINRESLLCGFFLAVSIITHFLAISLTKASYMIAVKRTSLLFSVIMGHYLLKESEFKNRLAGSILMILGLLFISMAK